MKIITKEYLIEQNPHWIKNQGQEDCILIKLEGPYENLHKSSYLFCTFEILNSKKVFHRRIFDPEKRHLKVGLQGKATIVKCDMIEFLVLPHENIYKAYTLIETSEDREWAKLLNQSYVKGSEEV